jgi:hypothetical protein
LRLANCMYADLPCAREVGHVVEAAGVAAPAVVMEGHDVPANVLTSVLYWLRRGCMTGHRHLVDELDLCRRTALTGGAYCYNEGCAIIGPLKEFKRCPQCKTARYCGDACQKQDCNAGGHKLTCGTFITK